MKLCRSRCTLAVVCVLQSGALQPVCVKVGDSVLLPEYGGTKVLLDDKVYRRNVIYVSYHISYFNVSSKCNTTFEIFFLQDYFLFRDADILGKYEK